MTSLFSYGPWEVADSNARARFVPETSAVVGDPGDCKINRKHLKPAVEMIKRLRIGVRLTKGDI